MRKTAVLFSNPHRWLAKIVFLSCLLGMIATAPAAAPRPNVLILVADDLGWSDVGYHNPEMRTPSIDKLVQESVELDCHYVMPMCTPTRVALLTGSYPSRFGNHCTQASNDQALPFGTPTLASVLQEAGYQTALIGKWHLGSLPEWGPNLFGFDYSFGSLAGAMAPYDHRYQLNRPAYIRTFHRNHEFIDEPGHITDLTAGEAIEWIRANELNLSFSTFRSMPHTFLWLKNRSGLPKTSRSNRRIGVYLLQPCRTWTMPSGRLPMRWTKRDSGKTR